MATLDFRFLTDYRMSQTCLAAYHPWLLDWFVSVEGMPSLQLQSAQILKESPGCPSAWAASELRSWLPPFKRIMQIALVIPRANRLKPWWVNFILWGAPLGEVLLRGQSGRGWRATKCQSWRKSRRKCSFCCSHVSRLELLVFLWPRRVYGGSCKTSPFRRFPTVKLEGVSQEMLVLLLPGVVSNCWFSCGLAVSMGEAAKPLLFEGFQAGCHVVLRGRRGTLWHSNLFDNVSKVWKLEEVSQEMLVLLLPRVSSRVAGFPVASLCLWEKLQNLSFSKVSKQVVMSFCVARVALCYIPTCLITCPKFFCVAGATMHSTLYTQHFTLHTLHSTL